MGVDSRIEAKLQAAFSAEKLEARALELGVIRRQRRVKAQPLVMALVATALSGEEKRSIASARREFQALVGFGIEESAFRKRLNAKLLRLLFEILERILASTAKAHGFDGFDDILAADSTTCLLPNPSGVQSAHAFPSTVEGRGGIKISTILSLGSESIEQFNTTSARRHDRKILREETLLQPNTLSLLDMGYYDHDLFADIDDADGFFIVPAKSTSTLTLVRAVRGIPHDKCRPGTALDGTIRYGDIVDADVEVNTTAGPRRFRATMVHRVKRDGIEVECWYITNLSRTFPAEDVSELYRLRWQIERFFACGKGIARLDHITSADPTIIFIQVVASLIAIALGRAVAADLTKDNEQLQLSTDRVLKVTAHFLPRFAEALLRHDGSLPDLVDSFVRVLLCEGRIPNPGRLPAIYASSLRRAA